MAPTGVLRARRRPGAWVALAALAACVQDVHRVGPLGPPSQARRPEVRVLLFGDFGYRTPLQWLTARAVHRESRSRPFDLAVQLGDNLYMCGPDPTRSGADACRFGADNASIAPGAPQPDDPIFEVNERRLEGLVARDGKPLPIFLALGNHDIGWGSGCAVRGVSADEAARRRACLSVARRTPTWTMPARHYVVDRGPVRLVVVDTNLVVADYGGFTLDEEIAFVREATATCEPRREGGAVSHGTELRQCFLAGHHPPAAVHGYGRGGPPAYHARMARLVAAAEGRARAFFAGHVHTLEHLSLGSLEVFVSGSTAMGGAQRFRYRWPAVAQLRFATSALGYAILEADAGGYRVRFLGVSGDALHCCEAGPTGPCRPVECS